MSFENFFRFDINGIFSNFPACFRTVFSKCVNNYGLKLDFRMLCSSTFALTSRSLLYTEGIVHTYLSVENVFLKLGNRNHMIFACP